MKRDWIRAVKRHPWAVVAILVTYAGTFVSIVADWRLAILVGTLGAAATFFVYLGNVSKELHDERKARHNQKVQEKTLEIVEQLQTNTPDPRNQARGSLLARVVREASVSTKRLEALLAETDLFLVYVFVGGFPKVPESLGHTRFYPDDLSRTLGLVRLGKRSTLFAGSWSKIPTELRSADALAQSLEALVRDSLEREWLHVTKITKRHKAHADFVGRTWSDAQAASILVAPVDRGRLKLATIKEATLPDDFFALVAESLQRRGAFGKVIDRIGVKEIIRQVTLSSLAKAGPEKASQLDAMQAELLTALGCNTVFELADQEPEKLHTFIKRVWPVAFETRSTEIVSTSAGYRDALVSAGVRV